MNGNVQYYHWVSHGVALGYLIACYLFFFALAEGTHIVSHLSWYYYRQEDYRPLEKVGSFLPFVILSFVSLFLIVDLGHPEKALTMIYHWNWTAPVAYGFYVILCCIISYAFHSFYLFKPELTIQAHNVGGIYRLLIPWNLEKGSADEIRQRHQKKERFWAAASVTFSVIGLVYLGFLLSSFKGRVAWSSAMMIFIFLSQGVTTGCAFLILFTQVKNIIVRPDNAQLDRQSFYLSGLSKLLKYAIIVQAAVWFIYFLQLQYTGRGGQAVLDLLLSGPRSIQFWWIQVVLGLLVPFGLIFIKDLRQNTLICSIAAGLAILGAFFGIVNLFIGGQMLPMTGPVWEQVPTEPVKTVVAVIIVLVILAISLISFKLLPYENFRKEEE